MRPPNALLTVIPRRANALIQPLPDIRCLPAHTQIALLILHHRRRVTCDVEPAALLEETPELLAVTPLPGGQQLGIRTALLLGLQLAVLKPVSPLRCAVSLPQLPVLLSRDQRVRPRFKESGAQSVHRGALMDKLLRAPG